MEWGRSRDMAGLGGIGRVRVRKSKINCVIFFKLQKSKKRKKLI